MPTCTSSTLVYAKTGIAKTSIVGSWARMVKQRTGKKTMLITREPGGLDTIKHLIDGRLIDFWDIGDRPYAAETLHYAVQGYLPDVANAAKLVAPTPKTFEEYGGFAFEGGTSFGEFLMEEVTELGALNQIQGAEKAPQQFSSGQTRMAGAGMAYYGIVQGRLRRAMNASQKLPVHILWTCRESAADDEEMVSGYKSIYGPQLIGQALTPHAPAWFGQTIHLDAVKDAKGVVTRKAFFKTHFYEGQKAPYIANPRLPVEVVDKMPESIELAKDGSTMSWLFDKRDELMAEAKALSLK